MPGKLKGLDFLVGMSPPGAQSGGRMSASGGDSDESADGKLETAPDDMLVGAASDVQSAFRERDPERLASALQAFVRMC